MILTKIKSLTRDAATGFTGTVGFTLLPKTKIPKKWQPYWDSAEVVMHSLARFAFYGGVGHHSTIGMGQARILPDREPAPVSRSDSHPRQSTR